jgi:hypothetical protein
MGRLATVAGRGQGSLFPVEAGTGFEADGCLERLDGRSEEVRTIDVSHFE